MKRFQQHLLLLPALGLLAPFASLAADSDFAAVRTYASSDQVTSIGQFGDVQPTDWAYQALSNLIETYGCVAGYPDGTYRGQRAMTRYEAAALLNACLDRISETIDELKKLLKEFERELALLRGRVDGLEWWGPMPLLVMPSPISSIPFFFSALAGFLLRPTPFNTPIQPGPWMGPWHLPTT
jgi:hypothetical protein